MKKYSDLNLCFQMEGFRINVLNIVFERFTRTMPAHSHGNNCYEIHYISEGYGKLEADGHFYEITPNTLYVTGPHVRHAQTPIPRDPMQEYCVYFKIRRMEKKTPSPLMGIFLSMNFWYGNDSQGIRMLMEELFEELMQQRTGYMKQAEFLLSQLMICLIRNYEHNTARKKSRAACNLADSRTVIIEEYFLFEYAHLSLSELADRLKLSPRQTQRLLIDCYGSTFQQKKTESRMSAAAILLGEDGRSVTAVSEALGYAYPEHFSNEFKKYYGVSPREFQKQLDRPPLDKSASIHYNQCKY